MNATYLKTVVEVIKHMLLKKLLQQFCIKIFSTPIYLHPWQENFMEIIGLLKSEVYLIVLVFVDITRFKTMVSPCTITISFKKQSWYSNHLYIFCNQCSWLLS